MPGGSRTSLNTTGISNTQSTPTATPAGQRKPAREVPEGGDTMNTTTRSSMYTDTQVLYGIIIIILIIKTIKTIIISRVHLC